MALDGNKELTPVIYGESSVKILKPTDFPKDKICFTIHWHDRIELLFVKSGALKVKIANGEDTVYKNSLVIIPPGKPHSGISAKDNTQYYTIMFNVTDFYNSAYACEKFLRPIIKKEVDFVKYTTDPEILENTKALIREYFSKETASSLSVIGCVYKILALLCKKCVCESKSIAADEQFKNVLDFIETHFRENISSAFLSKKFGYTEEYFCRRFKLITGITPMNYINILRLEKAKKLMRDREIKISSVSAQVGFSDINYFTRRFKKYFGITPSEYISKNRVAL